MNMINVISINIMSYLIFGNTPIIKRALLMLGVTFRAENNRMQFADMKMHMRFAINFPPFNLPLFFFQIGVSKHT